MIREGDTNQRSAALLSLRRFDAPPGGSSHASPAPAGLRAGRVVIVLFALAGLTYGLRELVVLSHSPKRASAVYAFESAITNPVDFAKSHVTGGIGAMLLADPASGLPQIRGVVTGSPAQRAGLRSGDVILAIDGLTTRGRTLTQDIECIRGIASVSVALTIQRAGSTNLNCVIHRTSWSGMGIRP